MDQGICEDCIGSGESGPDQICKTCDGSGGAHMKAMNYIERFMDWYLVEEDDNLPGQPGFVNAFRIGVLVWLVILASFALAKLF